MNPEDGPSARAEGQPAALEEGFADFLARVTALLGELRLHLTRLLSVQLDRTWLGLSSWCLFILFFAWCGVLILTASIAAVLHVVSGLTEGLTVAFGGRAWAGNLAGGLLLLAVLLGGALGYRSFRRASQLKRLISKYQPREEESSASSRELRNSDDPRKISGSASGLGPARPPSVAAQDRA